mgnify:CR=1 FL=1
MKKYITNADGRECVKCEVFKLWEHFHNHKSGTNGKNSKCKPCRRVIHLENEGKKLKTGSVPKPKTLQSQCQKTWDASGAAAFLTRK